MQLKRFAVAVITGLALSPAVHAEPLDVKPGRIVLPVSGLVIDLPKVPVKSHKWTLSASYALSNEGRTFDARDVIDAKVDGKLVGGTWVHVVHFDAGDCDKTVAGALLEERWTSNEAVFGTTWSVAGGLFKFDNELGQVPAVVMCTGRNPRKALLIYQFFIGDKIPATRDAILPALKKLKHVKNIHDAWRDDRHTAEKTRTRTETRDRGTIAAVREVKVARTGLTLTLPDDGFIWIARSGGDDEMVDWFERMAPALPEVEVEVAVIDGVTCKQLPDLLTTTQRPDVVPTNLPSGWQAGPTLVIEQRLERTLCHDRPSGALLAGVFLTPDVGPDVDDMAPLHPLFDALKAAAAKQ